MSAWKAQRRHQRTLYPGQREALTLRWHGLDNAGIAREMHVDKQTVVSYLSGARTALGVATIEQAVERARRMSLVPFMREEK